MAYSVVERRRRIAAMGSIRVLETHMGNAEVRGAGGIAIATIPPGMYTVELAAVILDTTPTALRARCRRNAKREGKEIVARLGAGAVAYKFGANWRLKFLPS